MRRIWQFAPLTVSLSYFGILSVSQLHVISTRKLSGLCMLTYEEDAEHHSASLRLNVVMPHLLKEEKRLVMN